MNKKKIKLYRYVMPDLADVSLNFLPTKGLLIIDNEFFCYTLEPAWLNNKKNSCIPVGKYKLKSHVSPYFGECFKVQSVPDRTDILIHVGNSIDDTTGCILLGSQVGVIGDLDAVLHSYNTFRMLRLYLKDQDDFDFEIRKVCK